MASLGSSGCWACAQISWPMISTPTMPPHSGRWRGRPGSTWRCSTTTRMWSASWPRRRSWIARSWGWPWMAPATAVTAPPGAASYCRSRRARPCGWPPYAPSAWRAGSGPSGSRGASPRRCCATPSARRLRSSGCSPRSRRCGAGRSISSWGPSRSPPMASAAGSTRWRRWCWGGWRRPMKGSWRWRSSSWRRATEVRRAPIPGPSRRRARCPRSICGPWCARWWRTCWTPRHPLRSPRAFTPPSSMPWSARSSG